MSGKAKPKTDISCEAKKGQRIKRSFTGFFYCSLIELKQVVSKEKLYKQMVYLIISFITFFSLS